MNKKPTYEALEQRVKDPEKKDKFVQRQKYFESVFHYAPDAIVTLDSSHHVLEWNPGAQKIFGYSSDEARGRDLDDLVSRPDVKQEANYNTRKVLSGQTLKPIETVRYRKDRTSVQVIASGAPIMTNNVLQGVVAVYTDISDRKQVEEDLAKKQYFLQKAQEIGNIGTWELDIIKDRLLWTDENYRIFGIPIGTELTYEIFLNCVHPDDREYVDTEWKASFNNKPYDIEHRLLVDGKVKTVAIL